MDWGPTNNTCAVWLAGKYAGTFAFTQGPKAAREAWWSAGREHWMNDARDDVDFAKFLPWCEANGHGHRVSETEGLQYSQDLADHWWAGQEPGFAIELWRTREAQTASAESPAAL